MSQTKIVKQDNKLSEVKEQEKVTPALRFPRYFVNQNRETDEIEIQLEMPGINKNHTEIKLKDNKLYVKALNERRFYKKEFEFKNSLNPEALEANMENGVLTITVRPLESESHNITIA